MKEKDNERETKIAAGSAETDSESGTAGAAAASGPSLAEQVKQLLAEKQELLDTLVRRQADWENYRKRVERERQQDHHRGIEGLVEALLPVLDGFDRALEARGDPNYEEHRKGFELIDRQLHDILAKKGLQRIEAEGKEFDPQMHHAIDRVESTDYADGTVLGVLQNGYTFHGRVLRPAMVRVATHPASRVAE